jgi:hypothetical protein
MHDLIGALARIVVRLAKEGGAEVKGSGEGGR